MRCGATAKVVGFAVTAALAPLGDGAPQGGSHILTGAVAEAGPDHVIVVANQGRTDVSCWGGLLSHGASVRGIRGVIAHGACRDLDQARELGFPVYAKATTPVTARGRLQQVCTNEPIRIGSVSVHPGDLMLADSTGVVVVPHDQVHSVLHAALALMAREGTIAHEVRAGRSLPHAMLDSRSGRNRNTLMTATTPRPEPVSRLRALPTAATSDALDVLGKPGSLRGISPPANGFRAVGPAFTVR